MATQNPYSDSLLMDAFRGSLSNAESLGRGFAVAPVGLLGDVNALARQYITPRLPSRVQGLLQAAPAAPTTEQILSNIPRASAPRMETSGMEQLGAAMNFKGPVDVARGAERAAMAAGRAGERYAERVVPQIMERGGLPAQLLGDLSQGSIRPMDVWHGSPYGPFTKFDPSKARTGEGNASYGEGAYLAEARGTGEAYRRQLAKERQAMDLGAKLNMVDVGGTPLTKFNVDQSPELLDAAKAGKTEFVDLAKTKLNRWEDMAKDSSYPFPDYAKEKITAYKGLLDAADKSDVNYTGSGFLYKVDLPDEAIPKMIDWDKTLGEQSKEVQQAIEKTKSMLPPNAIEDLGGDLSLLYGKDVTPEQFLNTWESFGQKASGENALAKQGVTGVRYLDQASRGITPNWTVNIPDFGGYDFPSLDEANAFIKNNPQYKTELVEPQVNTSNFVVFPQYQDLLTIKEINDQAVGGLLGR